MMDRSATALRAAAARKHLVHPAPRTTVQLEQLVGSGAYRLVTSFRTGAAGRAPAAPLTSGLDALDDGRRLLGVGVRDRVVRKNVQRERGVDWCRDVGVDQRQRLALRQLGDFLGIQLGDIELTLVDKHGDV